MLARLSAPWKAYTLSPATPLRRGNPRAPSRIHEMSEPTIICPHCQTEIRLTESLAAPLVEATKRQFAQQLAEKDELVRKHDAAMQEREVALTKAREAISKDREALDDQVAQKLAAERLRIETEAKKQARLALATDLDQKAKELADLQGVLKERDIKLAEAQKVQAEMLKKSRELDDARREMDLTIEKRVQESIGTAREQAKRQADEELKLKVMEKEQTISAMQRKLEDMQKRLEQGSQQLQGEVQELELETVLRGRFPRDTVDPVPKGEHGGDVLHRICEPLIPLCGTILWESKRTKNRSDGWPAKLRDDQRAAKAELAVIVSHALPKDVEVVDLVDGVWVTCPRTIVPLAVALRQALVELARSRQAGEGQQTKMELVYHYLTGPRFRHRVQSIVEKFDEMQQDLERERKTMTRLWAKREEQIREVILSTAGLYGDLQGIAGKSLQEIEGLELPALPPIQT
jgi:hypothetical protein